MSTRKAKDLYRVAYEYIGGITACLAIIVGMILFLYWVFERIHPEKWVRP